MTTVQAPPPAAVRPTTDAPEPSRGPRSRRWLLGFWAVVFVAFLAVRPGRMTFDTKLGVTVDPWQFLSDLGQLWHDRGGFGGIQDQYVGYAFPMLPFYGLADLVQLPVWLAERLWLSLIVAAAFWGALRAGRAPRHRQPSQPAPRRGGVRAVADVHRGRRLDVGGGAARRGPAVGAAAAGRPAAQRRASPRAARR